MDMPEFFQTFPHLRTFELQDEWNVHVLPKFLFEALTPNMMYLVVASLVWKKLHGLSA